MINKNKEKIFLDITHYKCPITFVKTKIALEKLKSGQTLVVKIKSGEALEGLPTSLNELGYTISKKHPLEDNTFSLEINKINLST